MDRDIDLSYRDLDLIHTALKGHLHKLIRTAKDPGKTAGVRLAAHNKTLEVQNLIDRVSGTVD